MSRLIDADALLAKFNKKSDLWTALTDEKTANDFALYCKVADAIEDTPTVSGWISVKDRLPTYAELKDECVLVLLEDGAICSTGFDECIEDESIFGEWRQNFAPVTLGATDSYWMPLEGVTHWMPIPKLPW